MPLTLFLLFKISFTHIDVTYIHNMLQTFRSQIIEIQRHTNVGEVNANCTWSNILPILH